jgi:hypothetical protein
VWPAAAETLRNSIETQKQSLFEDQSALDKKPKALISVIWDYVIIAMVLYFVISFLN